MDSLALLESRLAEALQALDDAAGYVRASAGIQTKQSLRLLGDAINCAWELREAVHKIRPDLKPDFVRELESDSQRYESLQELAGRMYDAEARGELASALSLAKELAALAKRGYFLIVAEAALYRLSQGASRDA